MPSVDSQTTIEELQATITCLERENRQLKRLAAIDPLTLVPNRITFDQRLQDEWHRGQRLGTPTSLIVLSVDHFQKISHPYGRRFGDSILQRLAFVLCRVPRRRSDFFARYGENQFALILPDTPLEGAQCLADRLLRQTRFCDVTVSIGITTVASAALNPKQMLETANRALYQAQKQGGNRAVAA